MVRIIAFESFTGAAANVGGPVDVRLKSFDVEIPELEEFLSSGDKWRESGVMGVEILEAPPTASERKES